MAKIQTREEVQPGVLAPLLSNQFAVRINGSQLLSMQVTDVSLDVLSKTFTVKIEQPFSLGAEMLQEIESIANSFNVPYSIDFFSGATGVCTSSIQGYCRVMKHTFELDYANAQPAVHILVMKYEKSAV